MWRRRSGSRDAQRRRRLRRPSIEISQSGPRRTRFTGQRKVQPARARARMKIYVWLRTVDLSWRTLSSHTVGPSSRRGGFVLGAGNFRARFSVPSPHVLPLPRVSRPLRELTTRACAGAGPGSPSTPSAEAGGAMFSEPEIARFGAERDWELGTWKSTRCCHAPPRGNRRSDDVSRPARRRDPSSSSGPPGSGKSTRGARCSAASSPRSPARFGYGGRGTTTISALGREARPFAWVPQTLRCTCFDTLDAQRVAPPDAGPSRARPLRHRSGPSLC